MNHSKIFFAFIFFAFAAPLHAQEKLPQYLKDANESIAKKDYKAAQVNLQRALKEVNVIMGKDLLAVLPAELAGMKSDPENDTNGGEMPGVTMTGLTVSREYDGEGGNSVTVTIMSNSPAALGINMIIGNPAYLDSGDGAQKVVSVGNYSGLLSYEAEDKSGDLQIPLGNSIISISADGFDNADTIVSLATKLDFAAIKKGLGEQ